jgi:N-sulfoglucosamine sulfohydrolase
MQVFIFLLFLTAGIAGAGQERPNILWLTCEDISPYLGCYGCAEAHTPHLDKLAAQGVRFTRAYSNAPVCAVARSTLLTGMYSISIGTHGMRACTQLPERIPAYPKLFREAGYYCTNNRKKDYNSNLSHDKTLWDESSAKATWKNRPEGKPFFAVFNTTITHESQLHQKRIDGYVKKRQIPAKPRVDPAKIVLPPYHPDLPEIRNDWARLHDLITLMDEWVGQQLQELEDAGLADDTIVFFYADHGGQLSRSKRYIYNVGTQVPFIVSFPERWKHLAPGEAGTTCDEIAQFVDFPKTALTLAGLEVPDLMQGRVLFGPRKEPSAQYAHLYRDRMAERHDCSRAVTDGRYYFIRNFVPHRPRGRDSLYGYNVQANWSAWREWYDGNPEAAGPIRSQFFKPKPVIELFDTLNDPWHVKNLAREESFKGVVDELDAELRRFQIAVRDVGVIPESLLYDLVGEGKKYQTIYDFAVSSDYDVERICTVAGMAAAADAAKLKQYLEMLTDKNCAVRYYGAYALFLLRSNNAEVVSALKKMAENDSMAGNRVMAAQALGFCGTPEAAFTTLKKEAYSAAIGGRGFVFHAAINAFQYSHTDNRLTKEDWLSFKKIGRNSNDPEAKFGFDYAQRIINDALSLWPQRRTVD